MADITKTVAPKTDQLNADDFIGKGSRTIKITAVREMQSKDQPIAISYEDDNGKPWKPCLGMRRVLIEVWGEEAAAEANKHYPGRFLTLYRDPDVKFGSTVMGGIRISHASHINGERKILVTVAKARRVEHIVKPIKNPPKENPPENATATAATEKKDLPPHAELAKTLVGKILSFTSADLLADFMADPTTGSDLNTISEASKETYEWVKKKYDEQMTKLEVPE